MVVVVANRWIDLLETQVRQCPLWGEEGACLH